MKKKDSCLRETNCFFHYGIAVLFAALHVVGCQPESGGTIDEETLYLSFVIHNEEDFNGTGPTRSLDYDGNESALKHTTEKYRKAGAVFQEFGAKINLQSDWTFSDGVRKFDPTFFQEWEAMGHENDPHAHATHIPYTEVYYRLKRAGANASGILGGTLEQVTGDAHHIQKDNIQEEIAFFETFYPIFYAVWGVASFGHQTPEERTGYLWRPSKTGSWFEHDPEGKIVYIGGNGRRMDISEVKEAYDLRKPNKVNVYSMIIHNLLPGFPRNAEEPVTIEDKDFEHFYVFLREVEELKATAKIEWKSLGESVNLFYEREKAGTLDFSDIDVNNIPRWTNRRRGDREPRAD